MAKAATDLTAFVDRAVSIITNDGKHIVGTMKGYDQAINVVLENCHERVYAVDAGVEQLVLGLYIVRGDNIAIIGELDEAVDSQLDLAVMKGEPLRPLVH